MHTVSRLVISAALVALLPLAACRCTAAQKADANAAVSVAAPLLCSLVDVLDTSAPAADRAIVGSVCPDIAPLVAGAVAVLPTARAARVGGPCALVPLGAPGRDSREVVCADRRDSVLAGLAARR